MTATLTGRGRQTAQAPRAALEAIDVELIARVGVECLSHARAVLGALIELGHAHPG